MSLTVFIIILAALILVHEAGHFVSARRSGVKVEEFGFGFPPRILSWRRGETLYSLNLIPFGGFVKIFGEAAGEDSEISDDRKQKPFVSQPGKVQAKILCAGSFANWLFAWSLISLALMLGMPVPAAETAAVQGARVTIINVLAGSPAAAAGFGPGDEIVSVAAGETRLVQPTSVASVQEFIAANEGNPLVFNLRRGRGGAELETLTVTPGQNAVVGRPTIGVTLEAIMTRKLPPLEALVAGFGQTARITYLTAIALFQLLTGALTGATTFANLSGPVGIFGLVNSAASLGTAYLLVLTAVISINLAIINLLPLPALDGGRLLFLAIEKIRRQQIKPVIVNTLNLIGFLLLVGLMALVTYHDVQRLF